MQLLRYAPRPLAVYSTSDYGMPEDAMRRTRSSWIALTCLLAITAAPLALASKPAALQVTYYYLPN